SNRPTSNPAPHYQTPTGSKKEKPMSNAYDPNAVNGSEVQRLRQAFADFSATSNRLYDTQLDMAREAQTELKIAKGRIAEMERSILYADEKLRQLDTETMTKNNQERVDRAREHLSDFIPAVVPF